MSAVRRSRIRIPKSTQAQRADRYALYQRAVQDPKWEMQFVERIFRERRGQAPRILREDFCGTALAACEWVRRSPKHRAVGVDLDAEVLAWARTHNVAKLAASAARRLTLIEADVLQAETVPADVLLAFNFSYWIFKERGTLKRYFERARRHLAPQGLFLLDAYGGYDAFREMRERQDFGRFTYIWDQAEYDPVSGHTTCHIHFNFPDGSRLKRAFSYHWRLWTLPELRELLLEAGFCRVLVYLEGVDKISGEGNGVFSLAERGEADPAWIAYLVAEP
ncbi:MAG: class I SAM-dependent methyltransferase [Gammaproteobacteria bacterium]|nr:class I SAM-dependent methyltransferase [Gammaproteobacteria bacterium]MBU6509174.1 class I SAM-dependent methyltransferase [Gammaproteobacteria bacterium]MDE1984175.1 class I SAM-dependent methyltransferase [Gammaproteobacteria bacterium]MDE2108785.1 class I SAM-dependent methyltransferase [Gammaproteobacteria bacterium]